MLIATDDKFLTDIELSQIIDRSPFGANRFEVDCGEYQRQPNGLWNLLLYKSDERGGLN